MCLTRVNPNSEGWLVGYKIMKRSGVGKYQTIAQGREGKRYRRNYAYSAKSSINKDLALFGDLSSCGRLPMVLADDGKIYEAGFHVFRYYGDALKQLMLLSPNERAHYALVYVKCSGPTAYGLQSDMVLEYDSDMYECGVFRKMKIVKEVGTCV